MGAGQILLFSILGIVCLAIGDAVQPKEDTGLESWVPNGFGTAKRGREAATAPKADSLDIHFGGASNR